MFVFVLKYSSVILSLIILSLAFMPCDDWGAFAITESIAIDNSCADTHNHSQDDDGCSPFCSCDCCGDIIPLPQLFKVCDVALENNFSYSFYYSFSYNYTHSNSVWRPPNHC